MAFGNDSFNTRKQLTVNGQSYHYFCLSALGEKYQDALHTLPFTHKVLLENLLRFEDGNSVTVDDVLALLSHNDASSPDQQSVKEIAFRPARVLMQDFTGVPAVVDLAAMRDAVAAAGKDPAVVNPLSQVDLVIDHSVMVDKFASPSAYRANVEIEMRRNRERYEFLRWGQSAFRNFRVVPPGTGICHQVNLEYLAKVAWTQDIDGDLFVFPDTLVGTDSHTTMINGLGVLGWGVGGIEAEAAMLGQPVSMLIPDVVGFELTGKLSEGVTATDLVLTAVEMLRRHGVVGKFVEFFGDGLSRLPLADRATIANMAPEYGATCGFFPVDAETLRYLTLSGRDRQTVALVEAYAKAQGLWREDGAKTARYASRLHLDLSQVEPSVAGPKRPQDRVALGALPKAIDDMIALHGRSDRDFSVPVITGREAQSEIAMEAEHGESYIAPPSTSATDYHLADGHVVIAAITSCTNTSNPAVMMAAGLLAKKAVELGLHTQPWVKTSLAPGSKVVTDYLAKAGYQQYLDTLGFHLVGYGCTTCIGNSGPLPAPIENAIDEGNLIACSVLSGNRNFEGRIHPKVRANWLASPPLVVAFALAGTTRINLHEDPVGVNIDGKKIYLKDIWPSDREIADAVATVDSEMFAKEYAQVFDGDDVWRSIDVQHSVTYPWNKASTYIQNPPFFSNQNVSEHNIREARILALLGDSITTDHISPAGSIAENSPAGAYLKQHGVEKKDFNSYGSRRGNHQVMMRGTFANVRIKNEMCPGIEGGYTRYIPTGEQRTIYDAAMDYQANGTSLVVIAGKEYGTGSSRDWAAKGTRLLGVKAVIAESFERIHRSNLIGMGVLPLQFIDGVTRQTLKLDGSETISIDGLNKLTAGALVTMRIVSAGGGEQSCRLRIRIDTADELDYFNSGGILQYVIEQLTA